MENDLDNFTYKSFYRLLIDEASAIEFCQLHGLLPISKQCVCGNNMRLRMRGNLKSSFWFRCNARGCKTEISIRKGSFFEKSKLPVLTLLELIFFFINDNQKQSTIQAEVEILSSATIVDWKMFCRGVFLNYFVENPILIGGPGIIIEIDEAMLVKRKYNVGRLVREQWVFGGYEVASKRGFIITIPDRTRETLRAAIVQHIVLGSIIMSDCWAGYGDLSELGYQHYTVNHSLNYVDPITGATTNHQESIWQKVKHAHVKRFGTARAHLASYLVEFLWRQRFGNSFKRFVEHIKLIYNFD